MPSQLTSLVVVVALTLLLAACRTAEEPPGTRGPVAAGPSVAPATGSLPGTTFDPAPRSAPRSASGSVSEPVPRTASEVLRVWDQARSEAFAEGDVAALRSLYADGSEAGTSDVRLLREYLRRGLRVEQMRMQLLEVVVLDRGPDLLRARVTDRLAEAVVVGPGLRRQLPRDRASTRIVELRRESGARWRVVEVSESSAPRRGAG